jgi:hypothetical protein
MELRHNNIHDKDTRKNDTRLKNEKHDTKHDDTHLMAYVIAT